MWMAVQIGMLGNPLIHALKFHYIFIFIALHKGSTKLGGGGGTQIKISGKKMHFFDKLKIVEGVLESF